jgi:hypothetical protein
MADAEVTNATRDRDAQAATKSAADADMTRLVEEHHSAAEQRLARYRAEQEQLESDPYHQNQKIAGNPAARAREVALEGNIAVAAEEVARRNSLDRIEHAFSADPATDPLIDSTTGTGSELPMRALRSVVEDDRAQNVEPVISQERFLENRNPPEVKAEARRRLQAKQTDPDWRAKVERGDPATLDELLKLSLVARAGPNEPPWSLPIYGSRTA